MAGIQLPPNVSVATIQNYLRATVIDPNMRQSALFGELKAAKCIEMDKAGLTACTWPTRYLRRDIQEVNGTNTPIALPYYNQHDQASIGWSEYRLGDSIPKMVRLVNAKGDTQIFDLYENHIKELTEDFLEALRYRFWQDGNKTQAGVHGLLTPIGSSTTPNYLSADNPIYSQCPTGLGTIAPSGGGKWWALSPTATYAGVPTNLGTRDNTWSGDATVAWPSGIFSPTYCYWSPIICNYNSGYFTPNPGVDPTGTVHSRKTQWQQALNRTGAMLNKIRKAGVDKVFLTSEMLADAQDSTIGQQRFEAGNLGGDVSLGIEKLRYNGYTFITEFSIPDNLALMVPIKKVHLWSMQGDILGNQKDSDVVTLEDLFALDFFGQMWMDSPAFCGYLLSGTAGT